MAYQSRKPSTKITLSKELFNHLISLLDENINANIEEEKLSEMANKLKDKLLTYSVVRNDDDNSYVDVRLFPNESSAMILQLLKQIEPKELVEDYYSNLVKSREIN